MFTVAGVLMPLLRKSQSQNSLLVLLGACARRIASARLETWVIALLALTVTALHFQEAILERRITIRADSGSSVVPYAYSDAHESGNSTATADGPERMRWTCELRNKLDFPYCGFGLMLRSDRATSGIDLSAIDSVTIDLSYRGPARTLTLYLKNEDPRYSKLGRPEADKFNQIDFAVREGRQTIVLAARDFTVPDWWINQNDIPPDLAQPQLDRVVSAEIVVGSGSPVGAYKSEIHSITFTRSLMSPGNWHVAIAAIWLSLIAGFLVHRRRQEQKLRAARQKGWQDTLDMIPQMVWSATKEGDEYYNAQWAEFTGVHLGQPNSVKRIELVHPDDRERVWNRWMESLASGAPYESEYRLLHRSGTYRWVLSRGLPEARKGDGRRWYGTCTDIHDRVLAAQALDASESLNRGIIEAIPDRVSLLDLDGRCLFANKAPASGDGANGQELGDDLLGTISPDARSRVVTAFNRARNGLIGRAAVLTEDSRWWDILLAPVFGRSGNPIRVVMVSRDVTEQKAAEEKARWSANHDGLTRLANRTAFQKSVDQAIAEGADLALLLFDVDDFKLINDTAGHDAGDALLCAFAERLTEATLATDTVARLGGDEFAVILTGVGAGRDLDASLDHILSRLREPCTYNQRVFDCRASIGVTRFPEDGQNRARLLKNADVALYAAKKAGKGNFQLFRPDMRADMLKRGSMTGLAREALDEKRVLPYYQPKLDLRSGGIAGFEALLRWRHPKDGIQCPAAIAAAFEDLTLAAEMSDSIIEGVIRDIRSWQEEGVEFGHVAINAAAAELRREDFADKLLERLRASAIPATAIQLEVTETVFLGRSALSVERALQTLSREGVQIALDDFGTGFASLAHLKQFPVDIIKIDRSFIRELQHQRDKAPIVDAVINLGRSLDLKVVAEGIETEIQHHFLVARGCDFGQGHLYSAAVPSAEAVAFARSPTNLSLAAA